MVQRAPKISLSPEYRVTITDKELAQAAGRTPEAANKGFTDQDIADIIEGSRTDCFDEIDMAHMNDQLNAA